MAGSDEERRKLLAQLKARKAALSRAAVEGTQARVGEPYMPPEPRPARLRRDGSGATEAAVSGLERITIRETEDGLGVHVPPVRNVPLILFMIVWLGGWAMGEVFALSEIMRGPLLGPNLFLLVWVSIWTVAGVGAVAVLCWQFAGTERLFITAGAVVHDWGVGPFRRQKVWHPGEAVDFRRAPPSLTQNNVAASNRGIAYDAGGRTRFFGSGMTSAEIGAVLAAIGRQLPEAMAGDRGKAD